jgi:hypothetical protein
MTSRRTSLHLDHIYQMTMIKLNQSSNVNHSANPAQAISNFAGVEESLGNEKFENIGDGCVVVCFWSGGSLIILWDDKVDGSNVLLLIKYEVDVSRPSF